MRRILYILIFLFFSSCGGSGTPGISEPSSLPADDNPSNEDSAHSNPGTEPNPDDPDVPDPDPDPEPDPDPSPDPGPPPASTCDAGERSFLIANESNETIWLGITAGTMSCFTDADCPTSTLGSCVGAGGGSVGSCTCPTGSECGSLAQCNFNNQFCFWNLPEMNVAQMNLAPGDESEICFPPVASGKNIQWSGNLFARTGCDSHGQNCKTGECGSPADGNCPAGTGGNPPASLAEFTLSNQSDLSNPSSPDYYDISIINGINVGISMEPVAGTFHTEPGDPYSCGSPGSTSASAYLPACSWDFNPLVNGVDYSTLLRDVSPVSFAGTCPAGGSPNAQGYCTCSIDAHCASAGLSCGLAMNASSVQYTKVCGTPIAWWTANQLCGSTDNSSSALDPLTCYATVNNVALGGTSTYRDLHLCTNAQTQSCYSVGASVDCCGCGTSAAADHDAWDTALPPAFGGPDNGCYNNNPQWVSIAQPWLVFLKEACPTAYTYPYDDATSTFTCKGSSSTGATSYQITFLPTQ